MINLMTQKSNNYDTISLKLLVGFGQKALSNF
jgi:hypothetical protein